MVLQWQLEVSAEVIDLIRRANGGADPVTLDDWRRVCAHYQVDLFIVDERSRRGAVLMDDILVVQRGRCQAETCCRIAHEISEFLLASEHAAPYYYAPRSGVSSDQERHQIARRVELAMPGCAKALRNRMNPPARRSGGLSPAGSETGNRQ